MSLVLIFETFEFFIKFHWFTFVLFITCFAAMAYSRTLVIHLVLDLVSDLHWQVDSDWNFT